MYPNVYKETSLSGGEAGEKTHLLEGNIPRESTEQPSFFYQNPPPSLTNGSNLLKNENKWQPMTSTLKNTETHSVWKGPCLAFMSGTFFTLGSAAVKALSNVNPMELLVIRSTVQITLMLAIAFYEKQNLFGPKGHRIMLQIQGLVGGLTLVLLFFTFRRLPLGDATTIIFSSPVFVMVLSFIILREPCGFFRTFIVALLLAGVILIAKPPFIFQFFYHVEQAYDIIGYTSALLATLFTALNIVIMRKCKDVHFSIVVLQLSLWSLICSGSILAVFVIYGSEEIVSPRGTHEWILTVLVSVLGLSGQILVARALGLEGAGKVAVIRSLDIILAFILQVTVFGEVPDWMSGLGAAAVLLCVAGMTFEKQVKDITDRIPARVGNYTFIPGDESDPRQEIRKQNRTNFQKTTPRPLSYEGKIGFNFGFISVRMSTARCVNIVNSIPTPVGVPGGSCVHGCCGCVNFSFLKTTEGILKLLEIILGSICQNLLISYGLTYSLSLGSSYYSFLTTVSASVLTSVVLLICYVVSHRTFQLVRQSLFETLFNGIISFLYLLSSGYLVFAVYTFLYPVYKITSIFQVYPAMSTTYIIGFIVGSIHGYDSWLAYKKYR